MSDVHHYLENSADPDFLFTPDAEFPVCNAEKGHLYVHTTVEIPVNMTTEQKDILRQFDASINHSKKDHHAPERKSFFEKLGKLFK